MVLDEYGEWFRRVLRKSFYPDESADITCNAPESLTEWLKSFDRFSSVHESASQRLLGLSAELGGAADKLIQAGEENAGRPAISLTDNYMNLYEGLIANLRRFEKDKLLSGSGVDPLTGLRTEEAMFRDLNIEMERRSRRGKPFCIVLARIDGFNELADKEEKEAAMLNASDSITKCIRSYDDSYTLNNGEFVLSLKHAEIDGGLAAIERLRRSLKEKKGDITMSCVTSEPQGDEDIKELIGYLREDLNRYVTDKDVSLQYHEVSPLKRYIQDVEPEE
jgi:GGDEF domain-containing protein